MSNYGYAHRLTLVQNFRLNMITQIVYLTVDSENRDDFLVEIRANAQESLKEKGVLQFDILQKDDEPGSFVLYEVYESPEALEAHRNSSHFKRWLEFGVPLLSSPREKILYKKIDL